MSSKQTERALGIATTLAALCYCGVAYGQTQPNEAEEQMLVKGIRLTPAPSPAGALDKDALKSMRARTSDAASLLRNVPGVNLQGAGGVSSLPVINGLAGDRVRTTIDGMDLIASCPNHMNPPLSYVDPTGVESLNVYTGISPVSIGGDSIAGTIVANTSEPVFATAGEGALFKGEAGTFYRSNGDARGVNLTAIVATQRVNLTYTGATAQANNYSAGQGFKSYTATGRAGHTLERDEVGSSGYETRNHSLSLALNGDGYLVEAKVGYQDVPFQNYPNQRMDMTDNEQLRFNIRHVGQFDWGTWETTAYREDVDHVMNFGADKRFWYGMATMMDINSAACSPLGMACAAGMPMNSESSNTGINTQTEIALQAQQRLRLGALYQRYRLDDWWPPSGGGMWPGTFVNINNGERDRAAVFAEWEANPSQQWLTLLGARYERLESDAGQVSGYSDAAMATGNQVADASAFNQRKRARGDNNWDITALARYTPSVTRQLEFGLARKVRSPNLYERYTWSTWSMAAVMNNFVGDGNGYVGDVELDPEQAYTASATFDWHAQDREWALRITPYYTRVNDYIDAVAQPGFAVEQFNVLRYANQSARLYGLDVSGQVALGTSSWGQWGLSGLINYTNGENRDSGNDLYNIMPLNTQLTLTHELGGWSTAVEWQAVSAKNNTSAVRNEIETAGYSLFNLRSSLTWNSLRLDLGVDNLFDRSYEQPLGGAYLGQGRTMAINPPSTDEMIGWGTAVPGIGRSLYAGLTFSF